MGKNNNFDTLLIAVSIGILASVSAFSQGRYANVYSNSQVKGYIDRLERSSNTFRSDFDRYMDRSRLNGTRDEDRYNAIVRDYEVALNRLQSQFSRRRTWWEARNDVQDMLNQAQPVNTMMVDLPFGRNLESQWRSMRDDINRVADTYDLPGLNGGGWNGGPWNGGGGGGFGLGRPVSPPNWAVGTFYGRDSVGRRITVTISSDGNVNADADGTPFSGVYTRGDMLSFQDGTSRVTREGNGFWTTRSSNGERTFFSRSGYGGGGYPDRGTGGYGNRDLANAPSWAVGTFYGTDVSGARVVLSISSDGTMTASADGGAPFYGHFIRGGNLLVGDSENRVSRDGNGFWTTEISTGKRTFYSRGR